MLQFLHFSETLVNNGKNMSWEAKMGRILLVWLSMVVMTETALGGLTSPYTRFACADLKKYAGFLETAKTGALKDHPNCNAAAVVAARKNATNKAFWISTIEPLYKGQFGHASGVFKDNVSHGYEKKQGVKHIVDDINGLKNSDGSNSDWIFILTLDGGGVRGIIPATLLQEIENKTGGRKIRDIFQFFGGTSTGGLIAAFLNGRTPATATGKPNEIQRVIELYRTLSEKIFQSRSLVRQIRGTAGIVTARYSAKELVQQLKANVGDLTLQHTEKPIILVSMDVNAKKPFIFSTLKALENPTEDFFLWQAARATSAAPTYFKPYDLTYEEEDGQKKTVILIDGGVGANNPTLITLTAVNDFLKAHGLQKKKLCVISLGTGIAETQGSYKSKGATGGGALSGLVTKKSANLGRIIDNFGDNATVANDTAARAWVENNGGVYFRINPDLHGAKIKLDDGSKANLDLLVKLTETDLAPNTEAGKTFAQIVAFINAKSEGERNALAQQKHAQPTMVKRAVGG